MFKKITLCSVLLVFGGVAVAQQEDQTENRRDAQQRMETAGTVFGELMNAPDQAIPTELLLRAECVAVVPGMKRAGFIVGATYGKGYMTCRTPNVNQGWSGPSTIRIEGGSFGAQIGAGETDLVLIVLNRSGAEKIMNSQFKLGGNIAAMAGPVGRESTAETDAYLRAEILSYSRSRGVFAGVSLTGTTIRSDDSDNRAIYGREVTHREILSGRVPIPQIAAPLYSSLNQHWPRQPEAARQ
jgi:SH3 domain-containing YSC84-like protein 1